jgi:DNA polymerase-3 subunit beta
MEFTVPASEFRKAFSLVARVVNEKSPLIVMQSVKVVRDDEALTLTAQSFDTSIRHQIEPSLTLASGQCLLPKRLMDGILSSCGDCELSFRTDGDKLHVSTPSANWTLPTQDPAAFPDVPGFDAEGAWTLDAASLKLLIARTAYLPNADQGGPYAGCLVEVAIGGGGLVATDKKCLASQVVSADVPVSPPFQPIIPVSFLDHARGVLEGDGEVHLGFPDQNTVCVRNGATVLRGRLLEGRFPAWRDFVQEPTHVVTLPVDELLRAVRQAAVCCSEESRGLVFGFGRIVLDIGTTAHLGKSWSSMPIQDGPEKVMTTVLDHRYVTDVLKSCKGVEAVRVGLYGSDRPVQFKTEDGLLAMISNIAKKG